MRDWQQAGIWNAVHQILLNMLNKAGKLYVEVAIVDSTQTRAFGAGELTGPSPTFFFDGKRIKIARVVDYHYAAERLTKIADALKFAGNNSK